MAKKKTKTVSKIKLTMTDGTTVKVKPLADKDPDERVRAKAREVLVFSPKLNAELLFPDLLIVLKDPAAAPEAKARAAADKRHQSRRPHRTHHNRTRHPEPSAAY